ncbi:MAG: hypothetical protein KGL11_09885 [Alphaproteobacteria bacterium]|nr:hypothetical protein [Alphaproteobacteria bacterium]
MRRIALVVLVALLVLPASWTGTAAAPRHWQEVRSTADRFTVQFPGRPELATGAVSGKAGAVQRRWRFTIGANESYQVVVVSYPPGSLPAAPDMTFYGRLVGAYAHGSQSRVRAQHATTIGGHPGAEAILDDAAGADFHQLLLIVVAGHRLYTVVSAGSGRHEASADALKFRNSFRLLKR